MIRKRLSFPEPSFFCCIMEVWIYPTRSLGVVFYSLYLGNITFAGLSGLGFIALIATGILKK